MTGILPFQVGYLFFKRPKPQTFLPRMLAQDTEGHIVNTASAAGFISLRGWGVYTVSKHAVITLSETLALELAAEGAKLKASVLCPEYVNTRIGDAWLSFIKQARRYGWYQTVHLHHCGRERPERSVAKDVTRVVANKDVIGVLLPAQLIFYNLPTL